MDAWRLRTTHRSPTPPDRPATANRSTTAGSDGVPRLHLAPGGPTAPRPCPGAARAGRRSPRPAARASRPRFPGQRLVVPAGRAQAALERHRLPLPRALRVLAPDRLGVRHRARQRARASSRRADGHDATLYFRERAGRDSDEFYANAAIGEFWIGPRPSLAHVAADLGLAIADRAAEPSTRTRRARADPADRRRRPSRRRRRARRRLADLDADCSRPQRAAPRQGRLRDRPDAPRRRRHRARLRRHHRATSPSIIAHPRGERLVEGIFNRRARADGNTVGYDTIAASGPHACILHWTRNDGPVVPGDLILLDAGVEVDSLYTADITRTLPGQRHASPTCSAASTRRCARRPTRPSRSCAPGIRFREVHAAAMKVIAARTAEWGLLPVTRRGGARCRQRQHHRRYMVHGTSHHLGIDVHDCAQARREMYSTACSSPAWCSRSSPACTSSPTT